ncbi:MAG: hypothetical protein FJY97_17525 [candidate division Zixibacteria bacterium]|nr:hypothetical protein [candidate division Zixibacteria bacterium]
MSRLAALPPVCWVVLAAILFAVSSLDDGLVSDDFELIEESRLSTWGDMVAVWTESGQRGFFRPLPRMVLGIEQTLYGLYPLGYHLVNGCIHAMMTAVWYGLLHALAVPRSICLLAGLLFAVHFVHVEPVYWVSSRNEIMMALLYVTAFRLALKATTGCLWGAGGAFFLALLTKESAITFPLVLCLWAVFRAHGDPKRRITEALKTAAPFFLLLLPYAALRWQAGGSWPWSGVEVAFEVQPTIVLKNIAQHALQMSFPVRTLTDLYGSETYSTLTQIVRTAGNTPFILLAAALTGLVVLTGGVIIFRRGGWAGAGLAFCMVTALPYLFMEGTGLRYMYLPSAGFVLMGAVILDGLIEKRRDPVSPTTRTALYATLTVALLAISTDQTRWWSQAGDTAFDVLGRVDRHLTHIPSDRAVVVRDLPRRLHGAYIFHNGFEAAMRLRHPDRPAPILDGDRAVEWGIPFPRGVTVLRLSEM